MIQNNLLYQREKCLRNVGSNSNHNWIGSNPNCTENASPTGTTTTTTTTCIFHYAVQSNGSTLGEELWKKRCESGRSFEFVAPSNVDRQQQQQQQQPLQRISWSSLKSMIQTMGMVVADEVSTLTVAMPPPPPQQQQQVISSTMSPPLSSNWNGFQQPHLPSTHEYNNSNNNNINKENQHHSNHSESCSSMTNILPNPRCDRSIIVRQPAVTSSSWGGSNNYDNLYCATVSRHDKDKDDDDDDDDDDFDDSILADFDVDQVVSQHRQSSGGSSSSSNSTRIRSPSLGNTLPLASTVTAVSIQSRNNHASYSNLSQSLSGGGLSVSLATQTKPRIPFDYGDIEPWSLANNDNSCNTVTNNFNTKDPSFTAPNDEHPHQPLQQSEDDDNNKNNVPLCDGHNLPARLLTANTSANMGRQFYKCSLLEGENCGFFQWQDGMEGNWNNNSSNDATNTRGGGRITSPFTSTTRGDIRDMLEANRRVFGHQSFRKGQREVIEKAMEGRDVFVLMPTG
jgi:hypothetical protein